MPLQFPGGTSSDRMKGWYYFHILLKRPVVHIYKKRETSTMIRIRGALPPARWRKGTIGALGLCGSMAWHIRWTRIEGFS